MRFFIAPFIRSTLALLALGACADDPSSGTGGGGGSTSGSSMGGSGGEPSSGAAGGSGTVGGGGTGGVGGGGTGGDSMGGSGGGGGGQPLCNGQVCRADQTCEADGCAFPCVGSTVPGDYATIEAAVQALSSTPNAVICLGAQTYNETSALIIGDNLTVIGKSAERTTLAYGPLLRSRVTLRGVRTTGFLTVDLPNTVAADVRIEASRLEKGIYASRGFTGAGVLKVAVDGSDITEGITLLDSSTIPSSEYFLTVTNSYIHSASDRACVRANFTTSSAELNMDIRNNTIVDCMGGFLVNVGGTITQSANVKLHNNIIARHAGVGITIQIPGSSTLSTSSNALFGNTTNYAGTAVDGPGYVKMDCLLDSSTPPSLLPGSPCLGSANGAEAPMTDYWDRARAAMPDIGAVEVP